MSVVLSETQPEAAEVSLVQQVQQFWNGGNQQAAIDLLRPLAEDERPWAAALMAWLLMQQGPPGIGESVTWAIKAANLGLPGQTIHTFNNAVGYLTADPQLANRLPELLQFGMPWSGVDLIGQGWNLVSQGQAELGLKMMMFSGPWPFTDPQLKSLVTQAKKRVGELDQLGLNANRQRSEVDAHVASAREAVEKAKDDLVTSARQAGLLVTTISSDATNALFREDATRNTKESRGAWRWGLTVLGLAALVAVLPVTLHYLSIGPEYSAIEQVGVHLASTAALATFAGVLLARARSRDRAAQRAHDLSTAMGTMISYSNQISDPLEKQRFMMAMGQVVLQSHLSSGSGPSTNDDSVSGMLALANLIRPSTMASTSQASPGAG